MGRLRVETGGTVLLLGHQLPGWLCAIPAGDCGSKWLRRRGAVKKVYTQIEESKPKAYHEIRSLRIS